MTNHTDLAARFEAKREECEKLVNDATLSFSRSYQRALAATWAEARDMARAGAAGGAGDLAELAAIRAMLLAGQGDDDGMQILPDLTEDMSVLAMVASCVHLLEKRRDIVECAGAAGGAGEGFVLVPEEPTPEMLKAASDAYAAHEWDLGRAKRGPERESLPIAYRALIAAAPPPPAQQGSSTDHE